MSPTALDPTQMLRMSQLELTYPEVGATAGPLPDGYQHVRAGRLLGSGGSVFADAARRLMTWRMHERAGLTVESSTPDVRAGSLVVVRFGLVIGRDGGHRHGLLALHAPCRVVYVIDEEDRVGFAYGTLEGHPESGEEAFLVRRDATGRVVAAVTAFSRPASRLAQIGGRVARAVQRRTTRRYLDALMPGD